MTTHLRPSEYVDALEQTLDPRRQRHLMGCARCQDRLAAIELARTSASGAVDVPEPSPLFWDHFSARVRAAVDRLPEEAPARWTLGWRPVALAAAVLVALFVGATMRQSTTTPANTVASSTPDAGMPVTVVPGAEDSLTFVAQVASTVSFDELQQAARPGEDATDAMVAQLTPEQRAEFVRLLRAGARSAE